VKTFFHGFDRKRRNFLLLLETLLEEGFISFFDIREKHSQQHLPQVAIKGSSKRKSSIGQWLVRKRSEKGE
jgi:ribosomal protein S8